MSASKGVVTYSAVWLQGRKDTVFWVNLTAAEYQKRWEEYNAQGYHVVKVKGYNTGIGGSHFSAIWHKN